MFYRLWIPVVILLIVSIGCTGGRSLIVSEIEGPSSVDGGDSVEYSVSASGGTDIRCQWAVDPVSAGSFVEPIGSITTFTASTVAEDLDAEIRVVVSADDRNPVLKSREITVLHVGEDDGPPKQPPVALATADPLSVFVFESVDFLDAGSYDPDGGDIVRWEWDWDGDGTYDEEGSVASHAWDFPGVYRIGYRVTDDEGVTDELDDPLSITVSQRLITNPVEVTPPWLNLTASRVASWGENVFAAGGSNGVVVFDVSEPTNPVWLRVLDEPAYAGEIAVSGGYVYVVDNQGVMWIVDIDPLDSAHVAGSAVVDSYTQKIVVSDGSAYVADASGGLLILDVDPPESAGVVSQVPMRGEDVAVEGKFAYVAAGAEGLQIVGVQNPESPVMLNTVQLAEDDYAMRVVLSECHAYVAAGNNGSVVRIVETCPPLSAEWVGSYDLPAEAREMAISLDHLYVATGRYGLRIADISAPLSPSLENVVYIAGCATSVALSGDFAYVADSNAGLRVVDITPPAGASIVGSVDMIGGATDVAVAGDYAYVTSSVFGVRVVDVSTPESARIVRSVDLPGVNQSIAVAGDYACVARWGTGLQIVDVSDPPSAHFVAGPRIRTGDDIAMTEGYAYSADWNLRVIDIDPPESAHTVASAGYYDTHLVDVSRGYAYVVNDRGLEVIDLDPPESAEVIRAIPFTEYYAFMDVAASAGYAAAVDVFYGLFVYDIDPPEKAHEVSRLSLGDVCTGASVDLSGGYAFVIHGYQYLSVVNVAPPESPYVASTLQIAYASGSDVEVAGQYAYVANGDDGLRIFRLW